MPEVGADRAACATRPRRRSRRRPDAAALEELRVRYLGRKSELTGILRGIAELAGRGARPGRRRRQRRPRGARGRARGAARASSRPAELESALAAERDRRHPARDARPSRGHLHLLTRTRREIEDIFVGLGYRVIEGPEVEHDFYNFTALNHPPGHPARMAQDSFYVDPATLARRTSSTEQRRCRPGPADVLLRTHTSPMQVRAMEAQEPPIFIIVPGRVYRRDTIDATHTPMFHQVEGLAVGEDISLADLAGTLDHSRGRSSAPSAARRFRPDYFPFTEPSVQVDVSCFRCGGIGRCSDGERDPLCKGTGWIEILGAGMVDPNVFGFVRRTATTPSASRGSRSGWGSSGSRCSSTAIPDLRLFFENDVRFLEQF